MATSEEDSLLARAVAPPPAERAAYLDRECGSDAGLRARIEALLAANDRVPEEKPGDAIGRYRLLEKIGEGGGGVVWMAEQREPVRRRVALKVIKLGMDTKEVRLLPPTWALFCWPQPNLPTRNLCSAKR